MSHLLSLQSHLRGSWIKTFLALVVAVGGLLSLGWWTRAQSGDLSGPEQEEAAARIEARQFAALAILHPEEVANEINRLKTPEELEADRMALAAVLDPENVSRAFEEAQGEEYQQRKALALLAMTDPQKYAEIMQLPPPDEASLRAILEPQALSTQVPMPEPPPLAQ